MNLSRILAKRQILVAGFILIFSHLVTANSTPVPHKNATYQINEFKLMVTAANAATALETLGLKQQHADKSVIYYFETKDKKLQAQNVILRARYADDGRGDSTVKIRASHESHPLNAIEDKLPIEYDWVNAHKPIESRALTRKQLESSLLSNVAKGSASVADLFTPAQRSLVETRVPSFDWKSLTRYGPIKADVWTRQARLTGFSENVTVEQWHLTQGNRQLEILEVSAKVRVENETEAQAQAQQFFSAAKETGLGEPDDQTKTNRVLDFFMLEH